ncbi:MAG: transglutaminase family protein [Vulcanimicrobiota bacterium]
MSAAKPFILILLILFCNTGCLWASEIHSMDRMRKIRLVYGLTVSNRGEQAIQNITVRIPIIRDHLPYQNATVTSVTPSAFSREKHGNGCSTARFMIDRISPGEKKAFLICADVEISEVTYNVHEKKAVSADSSMRQYLSADDCFSTKSPALRKKCRELSQEKNPLKRARKIYDYLISGTFSFSNSPAGSGVDSGFDRKHLNCSDAAALYLVMCRQCGIPARYVGGIFYTSERKWYPLLHAWVEIFIPPFG